MRASMSMRSGAARPQNGSPTWDVILEVGIAVCLVLTIVLLIRNYRGRR